MTAAAWGTVPEWFAAVGTVGAFAGTWWVIHRNSQLHKEQLREVQWDQAHAVHVEVGPTAGQPTPDGRPTNLLNVSVSNNGKRSIHDIKVEVYTSRELAKEGGAGRIETIPPGRAGNLTCDWWDEAFGQGGFQGCVEVTFSDIARNQWVLTSDQDLELWKDAGSTSLRERIRIRSWRYNIRRRTRRLQRRRKRHPVIVIDMSDSEAVPPQIEDGEDS